MKQGDVIRYQGIVLMVDRVDGNMVYASNPTMQLAISLDDPRLEILP